MPPRRQAKAKASPAPSTSRTRRSKLQKTPVKKVADSDSESSNSENQAMLKVPKAEAKRGRKVSSQRQPRSTKGRQSKSSVSSSRSRRSVSSARSESNESERSTAYEKGDFVAFVDPEDPNPDQFKIIRISTKVSDGASEVKGDVYKMDAKTKNFLLNAKSLTVPIEALVSEVSPKVLKKKRNVPDLLQLPKTKFTQIKKLVDTVLEQLEKEDASSEEEEEPEEEEDDEPSESPVSSPRRKIKVIGVKKGRKSAVVKPAKSDDDESMLLEEKEDISPSRKPKIAATQPVRGRKAKQIGQKRSRQEESDLDASGSDYSISPVKKKRIAGGKEEVKAGKKARKPPKMPTVYKRGKWNPDVEVVDSDAEVDSTSILQECCKRCTNRNVHRAVWRNDLIAFKRMLHDKKTIQNMFSFWGPDRQETPLVSILKEDKIDFLEAIIRPKLTVAKHENFQSVRNQLYHQRSGLEPYLMNYVDSGMVSHMAYGTKVRAVNMTRGNREGNNAFLHYQDANAAPNIFNPYELQGLFQEGILSLESFKALQKLMTGTKDQFTNMAQEMSTYIHEIIRSGNWKLASHLVKDLYKHSNYGYNDLHFNVLQSYKKNEELPEFKSVSVHKKASMNQNLTPLHFACINPDGNVLKQLLDSNGDVNIQDMDMRKPVHYAAACESTEPLELLVKKGANLIDIDMRKVTCLHMAARARRADNIRFILQQAPQLLKLKDRQSNSAMSIACENQDLESIKALLENGAKINFGSGKDRLPPLHYAASRGNFEIVQWLVENKARTVSNDKFKRSPLVMAVRNGHLKIASYLLKHGADWTQADSSANTPLHYAAAYGWPECMKLLLKVGSDINAMNSWKVSPINIAMLKNHEGCVKALLEYPEVDVNCKDEKGRTLLTLSLLDLRKGTTDFVKYLLEKGADPNIQDVDGKTSLHYLSESKTHVDRYAGGMYLQPHEQVIRQKERKKTQLEVADILIENGASLSVKNNDKQTPFGVCLSHDNIDLLEKLIAGVSLNKDQALMHELSPKILNIKYQAILKKLFANDPPSPETMNYLNDHGLTPFLSFIQSFTSQYSSVRGQMVTLVTAQANIHGNHKNRYKISNEALFSPDHAQYSHMHSNQVPHTTIQELASEFMTEYVVKPFIDILDFLVTSGANFNAQVQKLKQYRDLDEQIKKLQIENTSEDQIKEYVTKERAKKREEVLKEREAEKVRQQNQPATMHGKYPRKAAKKARVASKYAGGGQMQPVDMNPVNDGIEIDPKKEYSSLGLQNALHIVVKQPHPTLVKYLIKLGVNPDEVDNQERNAINHISVATSGMLNDDLSNMLDKLTDLKVRFDLADQKGRTPFLNFYERRNLVLANRMLKMGARVNQIDSSGLYALKYALIRRSNEEIKNLIELWKADVNLSDGKGRNLLHHAVNMSSATADATFETEQLIIEKGVDINKRDHRGRVPLHYAFVKIKNWKESSQVDPIETVSSLCGIPGLEIDVKDKWEKTPLHYASQRGASICAMYLAKRGASLESSDIYGNTPLGVALLYKHFNFGIIMIQKEADVKKPVFYEEPERIALKWKLEEKQKAKEENKDQIDADMSDESDSEYEERKDRKHRHMFDKRQSIGYDDEYDDDEDEYDEESDSDDQYEQNIFNQQTAFGTKVFGQNKISAQQKMTNKVLKHMGLKSEEEKEEATKSKQEAKSMFRHAILNAQLGLAYLMLDQGFDYMEAMKDAMDERKFQLVLTLLAKVPDDSVIQQTSSKGENLFHILAQNAAHCPLEHLQRIFNTFKKRGVSFKSKDNKGRAPLHYAVISHSQHLVEMLAMNDIDVSELDNDDQSPLTLYLKGKSMVSTTLFTPNTGYYDPIFRILANKGAEMNHVYHEATLAPEYTGDKKNELAKIHSDSYDEKVYKTTVLINMVRNLGGDLSEHSMTRLKNNLMALMNFGARFDMFDTEKRDAMFYAIRFNNEDLVQFFVKNEQSGHLVKDMQDVAGKSHVHWLISPAEYGSFENKRLLETLAKNGYKLDAMDSFGKVPVDYARQQKSGVLLQCLARLMKDPSVASGISRQMTGIPAEEWPTISYDYDQDQTKFLKEAEEKEEKKMESEEKQKELVPVDGTGHFEKSYRVYVEDKKPWDVYLTKVDLKNGIYGDYVFYKIQLLHDSVRDLYVVFTRWGRIGESGMNQRTPFNNPEEAKKEFCSIFKSKTQNDFMTLDSFDRVKKKYDLARVNYVTVDHKEYLAPFDYDNCPRSQLPKQVRNLFEEVANITMYQKAMGQMGLDNSVLPFSGVSKDIVEKATGLLKEIKEQIEKDQELSRKGLGADIDELTCVREKISDLTSRYYELVPQSQYKNQIAPPLNNQHLLKSQYDTLDLLSHIEFASKMLIGALYRQQDVNPIDYIHNCLNIQINFLPEVEPEHKFLTNYIKTTSGGSVNFSTHKVNIFKIQRKGEAENFEDYCQIGNRRLLYHGSSIFNFIGILSQGLRIAPPEAPTTGYMFGKGIYFADMFEKSYAYSNARYHNQESKILLLCEVALGNMKKVWQADPEIKDAKPHHSIHGCGNRGPDYKQSMFMPNGIEVPQGSITSYVEGDPKTKTQMNPRGTFALAHNEFIVYNTSQVRMRYLLQVAKKTKEELEAEKIAAYQL